MLRLIVFSGLPATGKTTLAKVVAKKVGVEHLSTDSIRKKRIAKATYSKKEKSSVYTALFAAATALLAAGKSVLLDATFFKKCFREKAKKIAVENNALFFLIELQCSEAKVKKNLKARESHGDESEADFRVYKIIESQFEPIAEKHLVVNAEQPLKEQVNEVLRYLERK